MTIFSPEQVDFSQIIEDVGQTIVVRTVTRTKDANDRITDISTSDNSISAVVDEVDDKRFDLLQSGYYNIGDINFYIDPDTTIDIFDKIVWNNEIYGVKKLNYPPKIAGFYAYLEIHAVKGTDV